MGALTKSEMAERLFEERSSATSALAYDCRIVAIVMDFYLTMRYKV